jgi:hypothetical protein
MGVGMNTNKTVFFLSINTNTDTNSTTKTVYQYVLFLNVVKMDHLFSGKIKQDCLDQFQGLGRKVRF